MKRDEHVKNKNNYFYWHFTIHSVIMSRSSDHQQDVARVYKAKENRRNWGNYGVDKFLNIKHSFIGCFLYR